MIKLYNNSNLLITAKFFENSFRIIRKLLKSCLKENRPPVIIYFQIAGFNFCLKFHETEWIFLKKNLIKGISYYLKDFTINYIPKKIACQIDFIWDDNKIKYIFLKKEKVTYISFYKYVKGKITCSYRISLVEFQLILNDILDRVLLQNNGFIIHASSAKLHDHTDVFLGKSGDGKSTVISLLKDRFRPVGDDTGIIKKEKDKYYFYQTPFIERVQWIKKNSKRQPLGRVFFLKKADFFKIVKKNNKNKISRQLISQTKVNREYIGELMKILLQFVANYDSFYTLYFARDKVKLIELLEKNGIAI